MSESKYSVLQQPVGNLLGWIKSGEIIGAVIEKKRLSNKIENY